MAKTVKRAGTTRRVTKRVYAVGQAVRVATQYDGTVIAEIAEIDGAVFVVRTAAGKTYRILSAEIV